MKTSISNTYINSLLKKGEKKSLEGVILIFDRKKEETKKYAIIISSKVIKKSTDRNYLKRITREVLKNINYDLGHFIIIYKKKFDKYKEVEKILKEIFSSII